MCTGCTMCYVVRCTGRTIYCTVYWLYWKLVVPRMFCSVCIDVFTLDAGLLAKRQYSEGPANGHLDKGFTWFPCVFKRMLRRFPKFQVATASFSFSPPNVNLVANQWHILNKCQITTATRWQPNYYDLQQRPSWAVHQIDIYERRCTDHKSCSWRWSNTVPNM